MWRGNTAQIFAYYAQKYSRKCILFDTFEGFDQRDLFGEDSDFSTSQFSDTSISIVRDVIGQDLLKNCTLVPGYFPEFFTKEMLERRFAVVSLDADLYAPIKAGLEIFFH